MTISHSPEDTMAFAKRLAATLRAGDVLALCGDLGAGKTHFVKGLAEGLGAGAEVTSPTFTLVQEYEGGRLPLFHLDFYRIETVEEAFLAGIEDYLESTGVAAVEWADRFPALFPRHTRWFDFHTTGENSREISERSK